MLMMNDTFLLSLLATATESERRNPMINLDNVSFAYGRKKLFRNLNLTLEPGNIYGLLGLNGAGKTTMLRLLTGLLFPGEGDITVLGHVPARRQPSFLSDVFVLPEELHMPGITGKEYRRIRSPFYPRFDHERFEHYLAEFDIEDDQKLTALSYGQKKKFLLSFGLASGAALFVMDEPTNGLDIPSKGQFRRIVAEAMTDDRVFLISTHQVRDVENLIDPIVILHEGKVLFRSSLTDASDRIVMEQGGARPDPDDPALIYSEAAPGGYWRVRPAAGEESGEYLDLEILFNTVIAAPDKVSALFVNEGGEV